MSTASTRLFKNVLVCVFSDCPRVFFPSACPFVPILSLMSLLSLIPDPHSRSCHLLCSPSSSTCMHPHIAALICRSILSLLRAACECLWVLQSRPPSSCRIRRCWDLVIRSVVLVGDAVDVPADLMLQIPHSSLSLPQLLVCDG
jgi:hypothetical protein